MKNMIIKAALLGLSVTALSACASLGGGGGSTDTSYVARAVNTWYTAAKDRLHRGQYNIAAALFDDVERHDPYAPWARRAQQMSALRYYVSGDYNKAIESARRFVSIPPGNKD